MLRAEIVCSTSCCAHPAVTWIGPPHVNHNGSLTLRNLFLTELSPWPSNLGRKRVEWIDDVDGAGPNSGEMVHAPATCGVAICTH